MKKFLLCSFVIISNLFAIAQNNKIVKVNRWQKTDDYKLLVEYIILNANGNESYDLKISFYDDKKTLQTAFSISGDFPKVTGIGPKTLYWDVLKDKQEFPIISNVVIEITSITGNEIAKKYNTISEKPIVAQYKPSNVRKSISFTSNPSGVNLIIDGKFAGITPYEAQDIENGNHTIQISQDDRSTSQEIYVSDYGTRVFNLNLPERKNKVIKPKKRTYIVLGGGVVSPMITKPDYNNPDLAYEFRLGFVKTIGVYARYTSNLSEDKVDYSIANLPNNYYYVLTSGKSFSRMGTVGGLMVKVKPIVFYAGVGWGYYNSLVKADLYDYSNDGFVKSINIGDNNSIEGIETNAGIILKFGGFGLSAGVSSIEFKYYEANLGIALFF